MQAAPAPHVLRQLQTCSFANTHAPPVQTHPGVRDLELTQDILWHIVLSHWVNDKVLVASRALCWPVLVALLLQTKGPAPMIRWGEEGVGAFLGIRGFWDRTPQVVIMEGVVRGYADGRLGYERREE